MRELLTAWRDTAEVVAADQWRRFFETGRFEKNLSANLQAAVPDVRDAKRRIGAARVQMVRYHVVGTLQSFMANRQDEFRRIVGASSLDTTEVPNSTRADTIRHRNRVGVLTGLELLAWVLGIG